MNRGTTVLITGATGFVGAQLTRTLVRVGSRVHIIVRPTSDLSILCEAKKSVFVHYHDGTTKGMLDILQAIRPDVVFHLASLAVSEHKYSEVETIIQSNLIFGTQLVEAMVAARCRNLVNTGTFWQHYKGAIYSPVNLYAASKQAFEDLLQFYIENHGLRTITLKLFDTYGPNDHRPKLLKLLQEAATTGETLSLSPGEQLIDLVFIDDVVSAFGSAAKRLSDEMVVGHEKYAVSSGSPIQLKKLVLLFSEIAGRHISVLWGGRPYRIREVMIPWASGELLPGWKPAVNLVEGLRKTITLSKMHGV